MISNSKNQALSWGAVFLIGLATGYLMRDIFPQLKQIIPLLCTYEGKTYKPGASFRASDGCNTCGCQNGEIVCTMMACSRVPPQDLPAQY